MNARILLRRCQLTFRKQTYLEKMGPRKLGLLFQIFNVIIVFRLCKQTISINARIRKRILDRYLTCSAYTEYVSTLNDLTTKRTRVRSVKNETNFSATNFKC